MEYSALSFGIEATSLLQDGDDVEKWSGMTLQYDIEAMTYAITKWWLSSSATPPSYAARRQNMETEILTSRT